MRKPASPPNGPPAAAAGAGLRLYVARGTPNSNRAEQNLGLALDRLGDADLKRLLELVDVFAEPKRAIRDGVIVTPTLIGFSSTRRLVLMGDLSDAAELGLLLQSLVPAASALARQDAASE